MPKKQTIPDLLITINYAKVNVSLDHNLYDDDDAQRIEYAVKTFSREVVIDKTYVAYENSKYSKTFLQEVGWNNLCQMLIDTKFGRKTTKQQHEFLQTCYCLMVISYIYMCLEDLGYDSDGIYLEIPEKSMYIVQVQKDTYNEYDRYPGCWQTW